MKIVVLDGFTLNPGDLSWKGLESFGDVKIHERTPEHLIIERVGDAEIVLTNKTPLSDSILSACPNIKYVGVLATGYNVVDISVATKRGITVTNIPTYGTSAVSQFTIALLLEICHHVGDHARLVKQGEWSSNPDWCFWEYPLIELAGKTIGIIGYGRIGQEVGKIAISFGMRVLAYDTNNACFEKNNTVERVGLGDLFKQSDVISLHCPLFPETQGMINEKTISQMKDGVFILNTSRGGLIQDKDLADALNSGKVAAAAVDVVSNEPIPADHPLMTSKNCIITPHIAWAPKESRQRLMDIAVDNLSHFLNSNVVNCVNKV